jgi:hypothetical protein
MHVVVYTMEGVVSVSTNAQAASALSNPVELQSSLKDQLPPHITAAVCGAMPCPAVSKCCPGKTQQSVLVYSMHSRGSVDEGTLVDMEAHECDMLKESEANVLLQQVNSTV